MSHVNAGLQTGFLIGLAVSACLFIGSAFGPLHPLSIIGLGILCGLAGGLLRRVWLGRSEVIPATASEVSAPPPGNELPPQLAFDARSTFEADVDKALAQSNRLHTRTSVIILSIDQLEEVRLGLGAAASAALEQKVFDSLMAITRRNESPTRLQPNLFAAIVQSEPGERDDEKLASRLLEQFDTVFALGAEKLKASISLGLARQPDRLVSGRALIHMAEIALYDAQSLGGAQYQIHSSEIEDSVQAHDRLARDLEGAVVTRNGLAVVYQPVFDTRTDEPVGAEAMLRWNHPIHGRVPLETLTEIAIAGDFIAEQGQYVIEEAMTYLSRSTLGWVCTNLPLACLVAPGLMPALERLWATYGVARSRLHIAIAFPAFAAPEIGPILDRLKLLGVTLVLDGVNDPHALERAIQWVSTNAQKADKLKLGEGIMARLGDDLDTEAALWSVMRHARTGHIAVAAASVDTLVQVSTLNRFGITEMQGLAFAPPVTALTLDTIIEQSGTRATG